MSYDFLIIGAGISGSAVAFELAALGSVALIEAETTPGYHSTGRSAALYTPNYGPPAVRRISAAGRAFFTAPPAGFCDAPLLTPRGSVTIAPPGHEAALDAVLDLSAPGGVIERISAERACALVPVLRPERVATAAFEPGVMDIDVASLHYGFLRGLQRRSGSLIVDTRIDRLERRGGLWHATAKDTQIAGRVLVNAAGAWAGELGAMAGAADIRLVAKRRTGIIVDAPPDIDIATMPSVDFADCEAYLKPEAGRLMASPGDATPTEPQDVQPDEWDIAVLVDWLERETTISPRRIEHSWAGLRTFVADNVPVLGFDAGIADFVWLAGQGGYGIMMAPTLARAAASLIAFGALPQDLLSCGISESDLSPARLA